VFAGKYYFGVINKGIVSKEPMELREWGRETQNFVFIN